jgi:hypothetical protein
LKILVLSQYFWPESFIINDIVRTLDEQGHEVIVATGKPNYPDGKVFDGYRAAGTQRERYLGRIEVLRVPLWPRGQGGGEESGPQLPVLCIQRSAVSTLDAARARVRRHPGVRPVTDHPGDTSDPAQVVEESEIGSVGAGPLA